MRHPNLLAIVLAASAAPAAPLTAGSPTTCVEDGAFLVCTVNSSTDGPDASPGDGVCEKTATVGNCSLRAAVMEVNEHSGPGVIYLAGGSAHFLTVGGAGENFAATGDLDVRNTLLLATTDGTLATVSAFNNGDRIFEIIDSSASVMFQDLFVWLGDRPAGGTFEGGCIRVQAVGVLNIVDSWINDCDADDGGAIWVNANDSVKITRSRISNSSADRGGAVYSSGPLLLESTLVDGNEASAGGGGVYLAGTAHSDFVNATFTGNEVTTVGPAGGAISVASTTHVLEVFNTTVTANTASEAGGIFVATGGQVTSRNSIFAGNVDTDATTVNPDCRGPISSGHSFFGVASPLCSRTGTVGDVVNDSADLGPLEDNGGPFPTHAPLPGSPVVDSGAPTGCVWDDDGNGSPWASLDHDARGFPRPLPFGTLACDMGAVESSLFADGFEHGSTGSWSGQVP